MIHLLQTIPEQIMSLIQTEGTALKLEKGMHIFQEGGRSDHLFLIKSGNVQISKESESGKELTLRICGANSLIGENLIFCSCPFHTTTAKSLTNTELFSIHHDILEKFFIAEPTMMSAYLTWLQTENMKNQTRLRDLVLHGKKGALYSTLIRLANTFGEFPSPNEANIKIALTNTELANLCATSREMINRMLGDLRKDKVIAIEKSYITILDLNYLKREIECENCPLAICRID
ncbi:Crp/Fnr family transcriptional regulator [Solibacillus silvestris]|uniref:Crp/Fnr family transcriptional regulator n=1 Tax=Solibacillus silvestris TaxID=76853 RepID=UPI003F7FCE75